MLVNKYRNKKLNRTLISPATSEGRAIAKDSASELQRILANKIHPGIFGYPRGKLLSELVYKIMLFRAQNKYIVACDLKSAFLSVDPNRLLKILRMFGVEDHSNLELTDDNGNPISFVGLPQGDARSPMLFAAYLTPLMNRLSRRCECFSWGDDLILIANSKKEAEELIEYLKFCITKHSYKKARLKLSEKKHKQIRIIEPNTELNVLGLRFLNEIPFPVDGKSAHSWFNLVQELKHIFANRMKNPETRRIWMKLKSILPSTGLTTDSMGVSDNLPWAGQAVALSPPVIAAEGMVSINSGPPTSGAGDFVGRVSSSAFSSALRLHLWQELLWHQNVYLMQCYEYYQKGESEDSKLSLFLHFVNEVEIRLFMFYPFETLSYAFRLHKGRLSRDYEDIAKDLYHRQLQIIDSFVGFNEVSGSTFTFMGQEKIKQILRGITHLRWLSLFNNKKFTLHPKLVLGIGTFTYPYWQTKELRALCFDFLSGKMSATKLDKEIKLLRSKARSYRGFTFGDPQNMSRATRESRVS